MKEANEELAKFFLLFEVFWYMIDLSFEGRFGPGEVFGKLFHISAQFLNMSAVIFCTHL